MHTLPEGNCFASLKLAAAALLLGGQVDQATRFVSVAFMCSVSSRTAVSISVSSPASERVATSFTKLDRKVAAFGIICVHKKSRFYRDFLFSRNRGSNAFVKDPSWESNPQRLKFYRRSFRSIRLDGYKLLRLAPFCLVDLLHLLNLHGNSGEISAILSGRRFGRLISPHLHIMTNSFELLYFLRNPGN